MKTLIIDNYDSFTYNLFHLFAAVTGSEPVVIKNDDPDWDLVWLHDFDQVVISPGPGNPAVATDMGISSQVIRQRDIIKPLLGICLGHQGICFEAGARVSQAPELVHGRIYTVRHTGNPLFDRIPNDFEVVRYHSLAVTELTDDLVSVAWTDDGILMAVAHAHLPFWGCQFHPESVCTQYGEQLVRNYCNLAAEYNRKTSAQVRLASASAVTSDVHFRHRPESPRQRYQLHARPLAITLDTETAFAHLYGDSERAFWLDSNDAGSHLSRMSVMGDASGPHGRYALADVQTKQVRVARPGEAYEVFEEQSFFDWLKEDLGNTVLEDENIQSLPFDVRPGWFGHLGYELKAECGGAHAHRAEQPDAAMLFADRILVFDHVQDTVYALAVVDETVDGDLAAAQAWADAVEARLLGCLSLEPVTADAAPGGEGLELRHSPQAYLDCIEACQQEIARGESYEICLTNQLSFSMQSTPDPLRLYRYLRRNNPTSFSAFLRWPDWSVLSLSPERFMKVSRDHHAESRPMKGTRKRSDNAEEDAMVALDLASNLKDKAENLMIVDLVRNDLGRCANPCSVYPEQLFQVETYATVHQLVSTIKAELRPEATAVDCIQAAFPGGSMTGAPKIRTLDIIDQLEQGPRGVYSGAIGYFALNGAADFSIVIRTLVLNGNRATLGCGGAIIALSDAWAELEETAIKSRALLEPFGLQFPLDRVANEQPSTGKAVAGAEASMEQDVSDRELEEALRSFLHTDGQFFPVQYLLGADVLTGGDTDFVAVEVMGVQRGLLFHCLRQTSADFQDTVMATLLLINPGNNSELSLRGLVQAVTPLESDAAFSTLSRMQQLQAWIRHQQPESIQPEAISQCLQELNDRYEGQAVSRPDSFTVYRLLPQRWQITTKENADLQRVVNAERMPQTSVWHRQQQHRKVLSIFS